MNPSELSPTKQALLALKQMQAKLEALEQAKSEPIAVVGMGCRFPGGVDTPAAFWQLLRQGKSGITEVPPDRWDINTYDNPASNSLGTIRNRHGGFVSHLREFDAKFFRISPREAISLDPQQRLLLEVSWEALEQGAISPDTIVGSQTGVFIGICSTDYWHRLLNRNSTDIDAYLTTGNTHSMASGRLSYTFGLTGPSLSVDTACSSSLVALHLACQSLRNQECHTALVGGVNRIISPKTSINFSAARMLSATGYCQAFDAEADGFVRSEGCGVVVLKPLQDAIAVGDNIQAIIRGSAINQDGQTGGLTVPNGASQAAVIRQALQNSRLSPQDIDYIETNGTGTAVGDLIEAEALGAVFQNSHQTPLPIGAVKTNIGHLEAAAGIASLIKVILALQHHQIPPNLHFNQPNPQINWQQLSLQVPTTLMPWPETPRPIAGVSAFGFSGTNAHVVLEGCGEWGVGSRETIPTFSSTNYYLFTLSAKTQSALHKLVQRYLQFMTTHPQVSLTDLCWTAYFGRSHFQYRLAFVVNSLEQLQQQLAAYQSTGKLTQMTIDPLADTVLVNLAQRYLEGETIDDAALKRFNPGKKISLPLYPFERQTYWMETDEI